MLDYFPKYFSSRAIYCYLATLALVSIVFYQHAMPFQFMLFGVVAVLVFFVFGNKLTMGWQRFTSKTFSKRLFIAALLIRVVYVIFIYLYYMSMTGEHYAFHASDELMYQFYGEIWRNNGFDAMRDEMKYAAISATRGMSSVRKRSGQWCKDWHEKSGLAPLLVMIVLLCRNMLWNSILRFCTM